MKKCACTVHAETHLPPAQRTKATSTWKSVPTATRSSPASRNWLTPPDASSASAASTPRPKQPRTPPRSNRGVEFLKASAAAEALLFGNHKGHKGTQRDNSRWSPRRAKATDISCKRNTILGDPLCPLVN